MLRSRQKPNPISAEALREAITDALDNKGKARFRYGINLVEKLGRHGVSIQDLLLVCRQWQTLRSTIWKKGAWRYKIEGNNCDGKWMAAVVSVKTDDVIAITGFIFTRGRHRKP